MNENDRRIDVGQKLSWFLITAMLIGFAGVSWATAVRGGDKADIAIVQIADARIEIATLKANFQAISYRLDEIKALIK